MTKISTLKQLSLSQLHHPWFFVLKKKYGRPMSIIVKSQI